MLKFILIAASLFAAEADPSTIKTDTQVKEAAIQQPHLTYILEEAAALWAIPTNEMEEAYSDGLVKIEETNVYAKYRVTYGGNSAIVSIEDRL